MAKVLGLESGLLERSIMSSVVNPGIGPDAFSYQYRTKQSHATEMYEDTACEV